MSGIIMSLKLLLPKLQAEPFVQLLKLVQLSEKRALPLLDLHADQYRKAPVTWAFVGIFVLVTVAELGSWAMVR